ncbi:unnamed protein product, partial [Nesidiocoris tenuis]
LRFERPCCPTAIPFSNFLANILHGIPRSTCSFSAIVMPLFVARTSSDFPRDRTTRVLSF